MTIYHLNRTAGSVARILFPDATLIQAKPRTDTAESVLAAVPKGETEFLYHFGVTYTIRWPAFRSKLTAALRKKGIRVYNTHANDLSRKTLQAHLAAAGLPTLTAKRSGPPAEVLLVRPNFNYSGISEAKFHKRYPEIFVRYPKTVTDFRFVPRSEIPAHFWNDEDVQIEKFVSNPEDKIYRVWMWGNRAIAAKFINPARIKKGDGVTAHWRCRGDTKNEEMRPVIEYGKKVFKQMKYDFGALDVLADANGKFYACDMNSTPWYGPFWKTFQQVDGEVLRDPLCYLRDGVDA